MSPRLFSEQPLLDGGASEHAPRRADILHEHLYVRRIYIALRIVPDRDVETPEHDARGKGDEVDVGGRDL